jgi:glycosyltransferase involved in cell wall biosynthesis
VLGDRLRALREAGFRVTFISSSGEHLYRLVEEQGVEALPIPIERRIAPIADVVSLVRLFRALRRLKPDITEFSTPKAGLLGNLAAWLCRVPSRVYLLRGLRLETESGLKRRILLAAERLSAACAHVVLCNSESLRERALELRIAPANKLQVLGDGSSNGVDVEQFAPGPDIKRGPLGLPVHAPVIGFVGRLTRDKGVPELIEAFDAILESEPSARLLLVGWFDESEDALSEQLQVRINRHPRITHTGFVADTSPYYRAMDVMVLPTWREGFPNVVLEAVSTGLPVITTLSTGSRDAVVPEVTGLLIPAGYPEAITEAVLALIRNPARRLRMGKAARSWVIAHFVDECVTGLITSFYKSLLKVKFTGDPAAAAKDVAPVPG